MDLRDEAAAWLRAREAADAARKAEQAQKEKLLTAFKAVPGLIGVAVDGVRVVYSKKRAVGSFTQSGLRAVLSKADYDKACASRSLSTVDALTVTPLAPLAPI